LAGLATQYNNLTEDQFAEMALSREVLPAITPTDVLSTRTVTYNSDTYENYEFGLPGILGAIDFQQISTDGGSSYGPGTGDGWRIIAAGGNPAVAAEISMASSTNLQTSNLQYILVSLTVEVGEVDVVAALTSDVLDCFHIAIGFKDGLGNRYVIEDSIASYSKRATGRGSAHTFWLMDSATLSTYSANFVSSVFGLVVSRAMGSDEDGAEPVPIARYILSCEPFTEGAL
jgi:hypothetical protein